MTPGSYTITEVEAQGYTPSYTNCIFELTAGETETCVIKNTAIPTNTPVGSIEVKKYACPERTQVTRSQNGVGKTVPAGCTEQAGAYFGYVHGEQTDANGRTQRQAQLLQLAEQLVVTAFSQ